MKLCLSIMLLFIKVVFYEIEASSFFSKTDGMKYVANTIKRKVRFKEYSLTDVKSTLRYLNELIPTIENLISANHSNRNAYVENVERLLFVAEVEKTNNFQLKKAIAEQKIKNGAVKNKLWNDPLIDLLHYSKTLKGWFLFLNNLTNVSGFNFDERITKGNVDKFIKDLENYEVEGAEFTAAIKDDEVKLRILNKVMRSLISVEVKIIDGETCVASGHTIKISDIKKKLGNGIKEVEIAALDKVVIDEDFALVTGSPQLSIISPIIEVTSKRKITLNGASGEALKVGKARNAEVWRESGEDGLPGNDGYDGGKFLAIFKEFKNVELLEIEVIGGNGSPGQDGGDGMNFNKKNRDKLKLMSMDCDRLEKTFIKLRIRFKIHLGGYYTFHSQAGDGGDGGMSGKGGKPGSIKMINLQTNESVPIKGSAGFGKSGRGSSGGKAGGSPLPRNARLYRRTNNNCSWVNLYKDKRNYTIGGVRGRDNFVQHRTKSQQLVVQKPPFAIINSYKLFLENNIGGASAQLKDFKEKLNSHKLWPFVTSSELIRELIRLESKYFSIEGKIVLFPLYRSLLSTIVDYSKRNKKTLGLRRKKLLSYLYSTVVTKITIMHYKNDEDIIMDIDAFVDSAMENINIFTMAEEYIEAIENKESVEMIKQRLINDELASYHHMLAMEREKIAYFISLNKNKVKEVEPQSMNIIHDFVNKAVIMARSMNSDVNQLEKEKQALLGLKVVRVIAAILGIVAALFFLIPGPGIFIGSGLMGFANILEETVKNTGKRTIPEMAKNFVKLKGLDSNNILTNIESIQQMFPPKADYEKCSEKIEQQENLKMQDSEIQEALDGIKNYKSRLRTYETCSYEVVSYMLNNTIEDHSKFTDRFDYQSLVSLDVSQFRIETHLFNLITYLKKYFTGFDEVFMDKIAATLNNQLEIIKVFVKLYGRKEMFKNQQKFAEFLAVINSLNFRHFKFPDQKDRDNTNQLEKIVSSNVIVDQFEKVVQAFQKYVFPFAHIYYDDFFLPAVLNTTDVLAHTTIRKIKSLHKKIAEYDATLMNKHDLYLNGKKFSKDYPYSDPFYRWENKPNRDAIKRLFKGKEEVFFFANVRDSIVRENAVKFQTIRLKIRAINESMQRALDMKLNNVLVHMRHLGRNYYRCDKKIYVLSSRPFTITHSLKLEAEPEIRSGIYQKLKTSEPLFSPFTYWIFKLEIFPPTFESHFNDYIEYIDIEIEGEGQFVNRNNFVCNDKYLSYYQLDPDDTAQAGKAQSLIDDSHKNKSKNKGATLSTSFIHTAFKYVIEYILTH